MMRWSTLVGALCALGMAVPAQAQYGGMGGGLGGGMGGGGGMGRGGMREGRPAMAMITEEQLEGPPTPGLMHQLLSLDDGQTAAYTRAWDSLMSATKVERDSAQAAVKAMRDRFSGGDRAGARANAETAQRIGKGLAKEDEAFDRSLKGLLSKEQLKQYDKWKDQNRKDAEEKQREEMRGRMQGRRSGAGGGVPSF